MVKAINKLTKKKILTWNTGYRLDVNSNSYSEYMAVLTLF